MRVRVIPQDHRGRRVGLAGLAPGMGQQQERMAQEPTPSPAVQQQRQPEHRQRKTARFPAKPQKWPGCPATWARCDSAPHCSHLQPARTHSWFLHLANTGEGREAAAAPDCGRQGKAEGGPGSGMRPCARHIGHSMHAEAGTGQADKHGGDQRRRSRDHFHPPVARCSGLR
jgi:hypothetical protein